MAASLARVWGAETPLVAADTDVEAPNLHLFLPPHLDRRGNAPGLEVPLPRDQDRVQLSAAACRDICRYKAIASLCRPHQQSSPICATAAAAASPSARPRPSNPGARELGELEDGTVLAGSVRYLGGRTRIGEAMTPPLLRALGRRLEAMLTVCPADVLLDSPPGVSCPAMTVARDVDAVCGGRPTPFGFHDFRLAHQAYGPQGVPVAVTVNRAGMEGNEAGDEAVRAYCRQWKLPLLAELPFERTAAQHYAAGRLAADISPDWRRRFESLRDGLRAFAQEQAMREIVVLSGKGGTGKTSVCASFAHLARNKVVCDLDVDAPDLHILLDPAPRRVEAFRSGNEAVIDEASCRRCGRCPELCRFGAVIRAGDEYRIDPARCEGCGVCHALCPAGAVAFPERRCGEWYVSDTRFGPMVHAQLFPGQENSGRLVSLLKREARALAGELGLDTIYCL